MTRRSALLDAHTTARNALAEVEDDCSSASVQRDAEPELSPVGVKITRADSVVDASTSE